MTIQLSPNMEDELRRLAGEHHRPVEDLVCEAVRQYLDSAAITDLTPEEVADTQVTVASELTSVPSWTDTQEPDADETR